LQRFGGDGGLAHVVSGEFNRRISENNSALSIAVIAPKRLAAAPGTKTVLQFSSLQVKLWA
jgi:hypothetical protein